MIDLNQTIEKDVTDKMHEIANFDSIVKTWRNTTYGVIQDITNPKKGARVFYVFFECLGR